MSDHDYSGVKSDGHWLGLSAGVLFRVSITLAVLAIVFVITAYIGLGIYLDHALRGGFD